MNEYQTFLKSIMRNQTLAILLKVTSPAIQAVFTQTAEETKAQLFQLVDKTEENMQQTDLLFNGLKYDFSFEKLQLVWLEMVLCRNVQEFDYYLSKMLRRVFRKHPEILVASDSTTQMSDEAILEVAERKVHELGFKSLKNIVSYLNDELSLGFNDQMPEYLDACEMFQVRNIIVHNAGIIDHTFIRITGNTNLKVGEPFPITEEYVFNREYQLNTVADTLDQRFKTHFGLE